MACMNPLTQPRVLLHVEGVVLGEHWDRSTRPLRLEIPDQPCNRHTLASRAGGSKNWVREGKRDAEGRTVPLPARRAESLADHLEAYLHRDDQRDLVGPRHIADGLQGALLGRLVAAKTRASLLRGQRS